MERNDNLLFIFALQSWRLCSLFLPKHCSTPIKNSGHAGKIAWKLHVKIKRHLCAIERIPAKKESKITLDLSSIHNMSITTNKRPILSKKGREIADMLSKQSCRTLSRQQVRDDALFGQASKS